MPHNRRHLGISAIIACGFGLALLLPARATDPPLNVLFIVADDLNCDLGTYGVSQVKTPNLDRLAAMGVRFDRAYCQQSLCGPSRASVMTGLRPDTSGIRSNKDRLRQKLPDAITLGEFFKNEGYYSGRVGKIFHYDNPDDIGTNGDDDERTWTERFNPKGIDRTQEENIIRYSGPPTGSKGNLGVSMAWWDPESADEEHTDGMVASQAIEMIESHREDPFFIAVGFFNPHCPYVAPKKYFDLYDIADITMPDLEEAEADLADVPPMALQRDIKNWPYYFKGISVAEAKQSKLAYYASVSFVDAQVGRLLDSLEANDLMDNTVIVFWSDHGYFLGEKGLWLKRKAFERAARVPLIIRAPDGAAGAVCAATVELVDLYPTLVDLAGFDPPSDLDGVSLRPLLEDPTADWLRPAITQVYFSPDAVGYSLRNERWRYTEWNAGEAGRELYDHDADPEEITNLADSPEHSERVDDLSAQLRELTTSGH